MPIYEYSCQECGKRFELLRRFQDSDAGILCPECESARVQRVLSAFSTGGCGGAAGGFT